MIKEGFYSLWTTGRGLYVLLAFLCLGIFLSPLMIADGVISDVFVDVVFAMILITGVFTTPCSNYTRVGMLILAILSVFIRFLHKLNHSNFTIATIDNIVAAITLVAFSAMILKHFLLSKTALRYRITAAVTVYLIFGVLWARLFEIVHLMNPNAIFPGDKIDPYSLIYFSFCTLTTLGYGDIVPVSVGARSLAILEGLTGQLYMVILISTLVSEFSSLAIKSAAASLEK